MIKSIGFSLVTLFLSMVTYAQTKSFTYSGKNWDKYEGHRLTIVVLDTSVGGTNLLAEQIIKNGKFEVKGKINYPQNAYFGLYNPNGDYVYKQEFIVEPNDLKIDRDEKSNGINIIGGKYNALFGAFKKDPEYLERLAVFQNYAKGLSSEDFKIDTVNEKYFDLQKNASEILLNKYDQIRFNSTDPIAQLLAINNSSRKIKFDDQLNELEKKLGAAPEIVYLQYRIEVSKRRSENVSKIEVGSVIHDFSGQDLNGNTVQLADVLKKNKYTLVEFWASWCGPCRGEIPHMKKAYESFKDKGFEILSFTLDHERARWEKASNEENIPWLNIGDLKAYKSPVVQQFGINGIPANYLVDPTGKVVAVHLRQEKLDEKLAELLK